MQPSFCGLTEQVVELGLHRGLYSDHLSLSTFDHCHTIWQAPKSTHRDPQTKSTRSKRTHYHESLHEV